MEGKVDRRVVKTKERLYQVFVNLLASKPVKDITVKELSEGADINRATFYLHYNDVFDLLEQIEQEAIDRFKEMFADLNPSFSDYEFMSSYIKLLEFTGQNRELCKVLLGPNGDRSFFEKLVAIIVDKCLNKELYARYGFSFAASGCVGVMIDWINSGMDESPEMVAGYALSMVKKIRE